MQNNRAAIHATQRRLVKEFADHLINSDSTYRHKYLAKFSANQPGRVCLLISYFDDEMRNRFFARLRQHGSAHYSKVFNMYQDNYGGKKSGG